MTGGLETRHLSLSAQRLHHVDKIQDGDGRISARVGSPGRLDILCRPKRCIFPESDPYGENTVFSVLSSGTFLSVRSLCFSLSTALQVFTSLHSGFGGPHQQGMRLFCYLDDWLVVAELRELLLHHLDLLLQLCTDLGIVVNWEKSDLQPSARLQYLGMMIHVPRAGLSISGPSGSLPRDGSFVPTP